MQPAGCMFSFRERDVCIANNVSAVNSEAANHETGISVSSSCTFVCTGYQKQTSTEDTWQPGMLAAFFSLSSRDGRGIAREPGGKFVL